MFTGFASIWLRLLTPSPAPASPHRRFAPQLLPPRNCLQGNVYYSCWLNKMLYIVQRQDVISMYEASGSIRAVSGN